MRDPSRIPVIIDELKEAVEGANSCCCGTLCEARALKAYTEVADIYRGDCFHVEDNEFVPLYLKALKSNTCCPKMVCDVQPEDCQASLSSAKWRSNARDVIKEIETLWVNNPDLRLAQLLYAMFYA